MSGHAAPRKPSRVIAAAGWLIGACLAAVMWLTLFAYVTGRAAMRGFR